MNKLQEAMTAGRNQVLKKHFPFFVFVAIFVGVVVLIRAYLKRNLGEAIAVVIIFFIVCPLFAYWWSRKNSN